jgi:transposase
MVRRHELTDAQWTKQAPLRPATGRPNTDHRTVVNGILHHLKTNMPWRDLPERYGPWQTVYSRIQGTQASLLRCCQGDRLSTRERQVRDTAR